MARRRIYLTEEARKTAEKKRSRDWYLAHRELSIARAHKHYADNREEVRAKENAKYKEDPTHKRAITKKAKEANPERYAENIRKGHRKWKTLNTSHVLKSERRRRRNPGPIATRKKWELRNIEKRREQNRARWPFRDKGRLRKVRATWRENNRSAVRAHDAIRRARVFAAPGVYTAADIKNIFAAQRGRCAYCRISLRKGFHADHIIPISAGGSNWPKNIQLLCAPCNLRKHATDPIVYAKRIGLLI